MIKAAARNDRESHTQLDRIMLSLSGKKVSFAKVVTRGGAGPR